MICHAGQVSCSSCHDNAVLGESDSGSPVPNRLHKSTGVSVDQGNTETVENLFQLLCLFDCLVCVFQLPSSFLKVVKLTTVVKAHTPHLVLCSSEEQGTKGLGRFSCHGCILPLVKLHQSCNAMIAFCIPPRRSSKAS